MVSDTFSNFTRVVKIAKQTSRNNTSYRDIINGIIDKHGSMELFRRGLGTRIMINGIQAMVFTVAWKTIEGYIS
jgi:hypothetical protein